MIQISLKVFWTGDMGWIKWLFFSLLSFLSNSGILSVPRSNSLSFLMEVAGGGSSSISHSGNQCLSSLLPHIYWISLQPFDFSHELLWKEPENGYKSLIITAHTQSLAVHYYFHWFSLTLLYGIYIVYLYSRISNRDGYSIFLYGERWRLYPWFSDYLTTSDVWQFWGKKHVCSLPSVHSLLV